MSSSDALDAVIRVIAEEAGRRPAFLARLQRALDVKGDGSAAKARRSHRRAAAAIDPFDVLRHRGADGLRDRLAALTLDQLRDVIAQYRIEPYTLAMKWKTPSRLVELIADTIEQRSRKGHSFRRDLYPGVNDIAPNG